MMDMSMNLPVAEIRMKAERIVFEVTTRGMKTVSHGSLPQE